MLTQTPLVHACDLRAFGEFEVAFDTPIEFSLPPRMLFKAPDPSGADTSHNAVVTNVLLEQLCGEGAEVSSEGIDSSSRLMPFALSVKGTRWPVVHLPIAAKAKVAIHQYPYTGQEVGGSLASTSLQGQLFYKMLAQALMSMETPRDSLSECGLSLYRFLFSGIYTADERHRLVSLLSSPIGATSASSREALLEVTPEMLVFTLGEVAKHYGIRPSSPCSSGHQPSGVAGEQMKQGDELHETTKGDKSDASCLVGWFSKEAVYFLAWQRACQLLKEASLQQQLHSKTHCSNTSIKCGNQCEEENERKNKKHRKEEKAVENGVTTDVSAIDGSATHSPFTSSTEPIVNTQSVPLSIAGQLNTIASTMLYRRQRQHQSFPSGKGDIRGHRHGDTPVYQYSQGCQTAICVPAINTTSPFVSRNISNSETLHTDIALCEYFKSLARGKREGNIEVSVGYGDVPELPSVRLTSIEMIVWSIKRGLIGATQVIHSDDGFDEALRANTPDGHIMMKKIMPYGIVTLGNGGILNNDKILHFVDVCPFTVYPDTVPPMMLRVIIDDKSPWGHNDATNVHPHNPTPTTVQPHSPTPTTVQPHSPTPTTVQPHGPTPTTVQPHSPTPTTVQPHSPTPTTVQPDSTIEMTCIPRIRVMGVGGCSGPNVGNRWSLCEPIDVALGSTVRIGPDLAIVFRGC